MLQRRTCAHSAIDDDDEVYHLKPGDSCDVLDLLEDSFIQSSVFFPHWRMGACCYFGGLGAGEFSIVLFVARRVLSGKSSVS